ncbi:MAG: PAS domain-containing protein, partial [Acidobacteriaceae bacterium]|nr:PAS domain-containing protein [Acidobacteriaceae bacterium]
TLADYLAFVQANSKELYELQDDILISVTRFFRDPEVFEAFKDVVLPQILDNRSSDQQVRIWVTGCSSGEEVYSLAISLLEHLTGKAVEPPIQIFGTDASERSVQRARLGIYPETIANEVSPERLRRFFNKTEKGYQVAKRIRDICIFARQNLCHDPPFSRLDLISCRNVLIYFGSQLQRQLIPTFHYALRPDGFLLLGSSETIREFTDLFSLIDRKNKIYSKIGATPPRALLETGPRGFLPDLAIEPPLLSGENFSEIELQRTADRIVLARYSPPGVIVNDKLEILQSRGHTSPFLELGAGAASLHLGRMAREDIAPQVTAAVKKAIEQDSPVQVQGLRVHDNSHARELTLEVLPMHNLSSRRRSYLVLFIPTQGAPASAGVASAAEPSTELKERDRDPEVAHLRHDLSSTRLYLQSLLEERDARNQELVSANEEIQSANEELQSTNEELETTKEEVQSSNEELETLNDELQNRNAVLTQASNDLSNLLNSVNLPVLMLSSDFSIRHFTPQTQRLMNVRTSDIGRPFGDIRLNLNVDNLEPLFAEVLDTLGPREIEVQDRDGRWYLLRVRPYRTTENKIDGLVMAVLDIDQVRRAQQELREARDFARSIIESIPLPLVVVDSDFRIRSTNEAFCTLGGLSGEALDQRSLLDLTARLWGVEEPLSSRIRGLRDNTKSGRSFELEHKTSGENPKIFLIRGRVLKPDGEQFLLVTFEDITAHKEMELLLKADTTRLAGEAESATKALGRSREELRALAGSLMSSQEDEGRRLARELHDDISQRLAALSMWGDKALANIETDPAAARQELEKTLTQLAELSEDVRLLSHRLHPSAIEDLGLATALRSLTEEFGEREDMITTFSCRDVPETLPVEVATGLYRIAQEAFRNVAKHAGKTHVKVSLTGKNGGVELQVADAGKGFDPEQKHSGLGLTSIRERARLIGATLNIQSSLGEGTKVTVFAPVPAG